MKSPKEEPSWKEYPYLTQKGIDLIKRYTVPRTDLGMGRFAAYKEYGELDWRIGYGSKSLGRLKNLGCTDRATTKQIEDQLVEDLKAFSQRIGEYIFVPLNRNRKAAVLSFAHSIGFPAFKHCRLLELINSHAPKNAIIREWSPYINRIWFSGGERMVSRRRTELDLFYAADKEIPTFTSHKCHVRQCLLNLPETYTGAPNQIKAIEYLERKFAEFDPSGEVLRRFFRYWTEKPAGLSSPPRRDRSE